LAKDNTLLVIYMFFKNTVMIYIDVIYCLDQELISYYYPSCCYCSFLVGMTSSKKPKLCRFKLHQDEIWQFDPQVNTHWLTVAAMM